LSAASIKGCHVVFMSHPEEVAAVIKAAAKEIALKGEVEYAH
jgi:hypothetical protein